MSDAPLHNDEPDATIETPTGLVRNLTAEEYAATYATGTTHELPAEIEAMLQTEAAELAAAREG